MDQGCFCRRCCKCAPPPSRTARTTRTARATQHARVACGEPSCKDKDAYTHVTAHATLHLRQRPEHDPRKDQSGVRTQ
eukprot:138485-Prymnesium_polylepis.1